MRTGAEAGSVEIRFSSKDVVMADEKPKHTPESVATKVVKALLTLPSKASTKGKRRAGRKRRTAENRGKE
jgi:hypothetical protein